MSGDLGSAASSMVGSLMGRVTGVARSAIAKARSNPRSAGSAGILGLAAVAMLVAILLSDGFRADSFDLDDSAVWVVNTEKGLFGRINTEIPEQDGSQPVKLDGPMDVIQDGTDVYVSTGLDKWTKVDPADLKVSETIAVPQGSKLSLAGGRLAMLTGAGGLHIVDADQGLDLGQSDGKVAAPPVRQFKPGAVMHVGRGGDVAVADPAADELVVVGPDGEVTSMPADLGEEGLAVSLAGDKPVALSGTTLFLPGGESEQVEGDDPKLQLPGDDPDHVLVASSEGLWQYPIDGGEPKQLSEGQSGTPVAPVHIAGCTYAAWDVGVDDVSVLYRCSGSVLFAGTKQLSGTPESRVFRVNRTNVVLNDMADGGLLAFADGEVVEMELTADEKDTKDSGEESAEHEKALEFNQKENKAPEAEDDKDFGARPGLPSIIPVLYNDSDPDNDVLTIIPPNREDVLGGKVQLVQGGQALQVIPDSDATQVTFTYRASDGPHSSEPASVTVTVFGDDTQTRPRLRDADSAAGFTVGARRSATYPVLNDWIDPEGDPLVLQSASVPEEAKAKVSSQSDGLLTYVDESGVAGSHNVSVVVADAPLLAGVRPERNDEGVVTATVTAEGQNTPPTARNDYVTTVVGQPVVIWPLRNDTDPNQDELSFKLLPEGEVPRSVVDNGDGSVTVTPEQADEGDSVLFGYEVTDGTASQQARIRVDVLSPLDEAGPSAALDVMVLPPPSESGRPGERTQDLLLNDFSPAGAVMVVTEIEPVGNPVQGLEVQLIEHRRLRVSYAGRLSEPAHLQYKLSDGLGEALGRVVVVPSAAEENLTPLALDDEVTVRAGDVVSVPVLANDVDPEGATLHLDPELAKGPEKGEGVAFVSGPRVRFLAPDTATTVDLTYVVADDADPSRANTTTGRLRISVRDGSENAPPSPPPVEARVLAGSQVKVTVPLSGVDPDGDSVTLVGLGLAGDKPNAPTKGRIVDVGVDTLTYEAFPDSSGTDVFRYRVVDSGGPDGEPLPGEGTLRIGIAPRPEINQPPAARSDQYEVVPGSTVVVDPLANDYDPDGDPILLAAVSSPTSGLKATVENGRVRLVVPDEESTFSVGYSIEDEWGEPASGTINVVADPEAEGLPPVARDDLASPDVGDTEVQVPVLLNDEDPDGDSSKLKVSTVEGATGGAQVVGRQELRIRLTDRAQVVPYLVTDEQDWTAMAVVRVPARGETVDLPPQLIEGADPIVITDGKRVTVSLKDHVIDPERKAVRFATSKVTPVRVAAEVTSPTELAVSDPERGARVAAVSVLVTDAPDGGQGKAVVITIPVEIRSSNPQPPKWLTSLEVRLSTDPDEKFERDLRPLVEDSDSSREQLAFHVTKAPSGVDADVTEFGVLVVAAKGKLAAGADLDDIEVSVQDEQSPKVAKSFPVVVVATTKPLPVVPARRVDAEAGKATTVDVLEGAINPFGGDSPLKVVPGSPRVAAGDGSASAPTPSEITFTSSQDFVGTAVVTFQVRDKVDRLVPGTVTYTVRAKPGAPGRPSAKQMSASSVEVTYSGAEANDSPITGYTVQTNGAGETSCGTRLSCVVKGLTPGQEYTFTVFATNDLGDGAVSEPSPAVTPDECPGEPRNVQLKFPDDNPPRGGQTLLASWDPPAQQNGTAVVGYEVTVDGVSDPIDNPIRGTEVTLTGLANGDPRKVTVRAQNQCEGLFGEPTESDPETPAGVPDPPTGVHAVDQRSVLGGEIKVSWSPGPDNGDPPSRFHFTDSAGAAVPAVVPASDVANDGGQLSYTFHGVDTGARHQFSVASENKAGIGDPSTPSEEVTAQAAPGGLASLIATVNDTGAATGTGLDGKVRLAVVPPANAGGGTIVRYEYRRKGDPTWAPLNIASPASGGAADVPAQNGVDVQFEVHACNETHCATASDTSTTVRPYGLPPAPVVTWNRTGATTGYFSWVPSAGPNGRDITGSDAGDGLVNGRTPNQDYGYGASPTITVRLSDAAGQVSPPGAGSGQTDPPPPSPTVSIGIGDKTSDPGGCVQGDAMTPGFAQGCYFVRISMRDFSPGSHTVRCYMTMNNIQPAVYKTISAGNGDFQDCSFSSAGRWVWVVVDGTVQGGNVSANQYGWAVDHHSGVISNVSPQWPTN